MAGGGSECLDDDAPGRQPARRAGSGSASVDRDAPHAAGALRLLARLSEEDGAAANGLAARGAGDPERVAAYLANLPGLADHTILGLLDDLRLVAMAMAPGEDWSWLRRVILRLRHQRPAASCSRLGSI
jgi:hypothetical protein